MRTLGSSKALLLAVLVDTPEDINTVVDCLLVGVSGKKGGGHGEKSHVLHLQFENG